MSSNKTFIITGTSKGLGKELASILMEKSDAYVISISRSLTPTQQDYNANRFSFIKIDLSKKEEFKKIALIKKMVLTDELIFINNASLIKPIYKVGELNLGQTEELIMVNLNSSIFFCNYLLSEFQNKKITMINITSGAAKTPIKNWSLYCSTKAAISMFFDVMKEEFPEHTIYSIDPGVMDTNMQSQIRNSHFDRLDEFINLKKNNILKSPKNVALSIIRPLL